VARTATSARVGRELRLLERCRAIAIGELAVGDQWWLRAEGLWGRWEGWGGRWAGAWPALVLLPGRRDSGRPAVLVERRGVFTKPRDCVRGGAVSVGGGGCGWGGHGWWVGFCWGDVLLRGGGADVSG